MCVWQRLWDDKDICNKNMLPHRVLRWCKFQTYLCGFVTCVKARTDVQAALWRLSYKLIRIGQLWMEYLGLFSPCLNMHLKWQGKVRPQQTCLDALRDSKTVHQCASALMATFANNRSQLHHMHIPELHIKLNSWPLTGLLKIKLSLD